MGLQNRVDPLGRLIETSARGGWMGNRGLLHDKDQAIRRDWRLKAWLICQLHFKGRRRSVMSPGLYTELFFLDEASALSAGHRPCAECRREDYIRFKSAAALGARRAFNYAAEMDAALHADRMTSQGRKMTFSAEASDLPDGTMVLIGDAPWLKRRDRVHRWTPFGYDEQRALGVGQAEVLTPRLTVEAIRAGYTPQIALG